MESKIIDHLGLISGIWDELQISETIDQAIVQDDTYRHVSVGNLCKSLVLNGLGFTERTLYMVSSFFKNKPTSLLLGKGIGLPSKYVTIFIRPLF
jgi:transposase